MYSSLQLLWHRDQGFAAEIARLALLIAEFQCDVRMISQQEARLNVLPLHKTGQISTGNALRMNWLAVCPPTTKMEQWAVDLFGNEPEQSEIEFDAKEGETFRDGLRSDAYRFLLFQHAWLEHVSHTIAH